jgi:hypothetical protein
MVIQRLYSTLELVVSVKVRTEEHVDLLACHLTSYRLYRLGKPVELPSKSCFSLCCGLPISWFIRRRDEEGPILEL